MIARLWQPAQDWCQRHPLLVSVAFTALTVGAGWWRGLPAVAMLAGVGGGLAVLARWLPTHLAIAGPAGALIAAGTLALPSLAGRHGAVAWLVGAVAALCLLRQGVTGPTRALATSWLWLATPIAIVVSLVSAGSASAGSASAGTAMASPGPPAEAQAAAWGCLAASLIASLWIGAVTTVRAAAPPGPLPLTMDPARPAGQAMALHLALVLLALGMTAVVDWPDAHRRDPWLWIAPVLLVAIWLSTTASVGTALSAVAGSAGVCGFLIAPTSADQSLPPTAILAMAQLPALLWWLLRRRQGQPDALAVGGTAIAAAMALPDSRHGLIALAASGAGLIAVHAWDRQGPLAAIDPAGAARGPWRIRLRAARAFAGTGMGWRIYALMEFAWDPAHRRLAADPAPWGRVLDAGCGPGLVAARAVVRSDVSGYLGIDPDGEKLLIARRVLARLGRPLPDRRELLLASLPLAHPMPQRFDTAFLIDVLHYWPEETQRAILIQIRAALVPGGRLWLRDGIADAAGRGGAVGFGEWFTTAFALNVRGKGLHFPQEERMRAMVMECGFIIEGVDGAGGCSRLWRCR